MYAPQMGRFLQRDPIGYPDGPNAYAGYAAMYGSVDPFGLYELDIHFYMTYYLACKCGLANDPCEVENQYDYDTDQTNLAACRSVNNMEASNGDDMTIRKKQISSRIKNRLPI